MGMSNRTPKLPAVLFATATFAAAFPAIAAVDFKGAVAPILQEKCIECHGPEKQKGKLRLDSKADAFKGGKSGVDIKPGDGAGSDLVRRLQLPKSDDDHMPPEGDPLSAAQIDALKQWIAEGANWPDGVTISPKVVASAAPAPVVPAGPPPPPPSELPKEFKPEAAEAAAIAAIAKAGVDVPVIAQNVPWRSVNLRLAGASVTDATIAPLKDIKSLVEVNLATTKVTDAGLAPLEKLTYLQNLQLQLTGVTDAGLAHVEKLENLMVLNLYGTAVTDAGLEHLKGLKHLRSLYLWQSKVTAEGAKKLQDALPGLYVNMGWETLAAAKEEKKDEKKEEKK
jgi:Planctomycete cytochrome C